MYVQKKYQVNIWKKRKSTIDQIFVTSQIMTNCFGMQFYSLYVRTEKKFWILYTRIVRFKIFYDFVHLYITIDRICSLNFYVFVFFSNAQAKICINFVQKWEYVWQHDRNFLEAFCESSMNVPVVYRWYKCTQDSCELVEDANQQSVK